MAIQVYAVLEENSDFKKKGKGENPELVLKNAYGTLEKLKHEGYSFAYEIRKRMVIIVSNVLQAHPFSGHFLLSTSVGCKYVPYFLCKFSYS